MLELPQTPTTELVHPRLLEPASPSWLLIRLAVETHVHHAAADSDRLALVEDATPAAYREFLEGVFGFEARYEEALILAPEVDPSLLRIRARSERLRRDLVALGVGEAALDALPRCAAIPMFETAAQAMGWLYVVERNTLLHGLVRRHLARALPDTIAHAGSYFSAYEDDAGERYRELGPALEEVARRAITPGQIVAAAHEAFVYQHAWFVELRRTSRLAS